MELSVVENESKKERARKLAGASAYVVLLTVSFRFGSFLGSVGTPPSDPMREEAYALLTRLTWTIPIEKSLHYKDPESTKRYVAAMVAVDWHAYTRLAKYLNTEERVQLEKEIELLKQCPEKSPWISGETPQEEDRNGDELTSRQIRKPRTSMRQDWQSVRVGFMELISELIPRRVVLVPVDPLDIRPPPGPSPDQKGTVVQEPHPPRSWPWEK